MRTSHFTRYLTAVAVLVAAAAACSANADPNASPPPPGLFTQVSTNGPAPSSEPTATKAPPTTKPTWVTRLDYYPTIAVPNSFGCGDNGPTRLTGRRGAGTFAQTGGGYERVEPYVHSAVATYFGTDPFSDHLIEGKTPILYVTQCQAPGHIDPLRYYTMTGMLWDGHDLHAVGTPQRIGTADPEKGCKRTTNESQVVNGTASMLAGCTWRVTITATEFSAVPA